jgi:hypothetical protein
MPSHMKENITDLVEQEQQDAQEDTMKRVQEKIDTMPANDLHSEGTVSWFSAWAQYGALTEIFKDHDCTTVRRR